MWPSSHVGLSLVDQRCFNMEQEKKELLFNKLIIIGFIGYFLILLVERVLALVFSVNQGYELALVNHTFIGIATYVITALSVVAGLVLFAKPCLGMFSKFFSKEKYDLQSNYSKIILASMVFLVSGMMHTGFTLAVVQFIAYGFLIMSMIVANIEFCLKDKANRFVYIVSLIYLVLFSMAIPVVYTIIEYRVVFYITEFLAVFILIPLFGIALKSLFLKGRVSFCIYMIIPMVVLDTLIIGLKWNQEINWFLLIFASLTLLFYLSFGLMARYKKELLDDSVNKQSEEN